MYGKGEKECSEAGAEEGKEREAEEGVEEDSVTFEGTPTLSHNSSLLPSNLTHE